MKIYIVHHFTWGNKEIIGAYEKEERAADYCKQWNTYHPSSDQCSYCDTDLAMGVAND